ncbi:hypothetical protein [Robinsoniella peoriensis]|uniref:hypothetical protein n=1 Tax=Robinsoniella peoriensis TaxID=180332 RepID=UPI003640C3E4
MSVKQITNKENILNGTTDAQGGFFCTLTSSGADHPAFVIAPDKIDKFLSSDTDAPFKRAMERFINHGGIVTK